MSLHQSLRSPHRRGRCRCHTARMCARSLSSTSTTTHQHRKDKCFVQRLGKSVRGSDFQKCLAGLAGRYNDETGDLKGLETQSLDVKLAAVQVIALCVDSKGDAPSEAAKCMYVCRGWQQGHIVAPDASLVVCSGELLHGWLCQGKFLEQGSQKKGRCVNLPRPRALACVRAIRCEVGTVTWCAGTLPRLRGGE